MRFVMNIVWFSQLVLLPVAAFASSARLATEMKTKRVIPFAMGMALESRIDREVNPAYSGARSAGRFFQQVQLRPWVMMLEIGYEKNNSNAGGYGVRARSVAASFWGRYDLIEGGHWTPFVSLGVGAYFDRVITKLPDDSDVRRGTRKLVGVGAGVSRVFWEHVLMEAELRGSAVQDRRDPMASVVLRAGLQI